LFFYPEIDHNEKLKDVGFVEAVVKFSGSFSFDDTTPNDVLTMKTTKTLRLFFEPEKDFWIVLVSLITTYQLVVVLHVSDSRQSMFLLSVKRKTRKSS